MQHIPVLLQEVLDGLQCRQGGIFLDCTVGGGGHAAAILEQHPANRVIGLDRDASVLALAGQRLEKFGDRVALHHARFENFERLLGNQVFDGIVFDLGVSSFQLDDPARGFSFQQPARLDMRMDQSLADTGATRTAHQLVNTYSAEELADIFFQYGEERQSRPIARAIVAARAAQPIETTTELAEIVSRAVPRRFHPRNIHPATRVFQAQRIEVNAELDRLGATLERAVAHLRNGGRICVIAFHSLEDRIVKRTFVKLAKGCQCPPDFPACACGLTPTLKILSRKPILAAAAELAQNPRARSARLRIAEKIEN